jgi:predicted Zn finger-like uncharacterized protein
VRPQRKRFQNGMKFVCDRCQTKYSIADERVRGKVLKVKCKSCANLITVREGGRRPSSAGLPTLSAAGAAAPVAAPAPVRAPAPAPRESPRQAPQQAPYEEESERTVLALHPPDPALMAAAPRRTTGSMAALAGSGAGADDGLQWYMALDGHRTGPFPRKQLVDRLVALPRDADLHIWNDRLDGWKVPTDVPAVANDLMARRKPAPPPPPGAPRRPTPAPPPPPVDARVTRRPTPPPGAPLGSGLGLKLPPPTGAPPKPSAPPLAAAGAGDLFAAHPPPAAHTGGDPASLLETPAPMPHMHPGLPKTNGVGNTSGSGAHHPHESSASLRPALRSTTDGLNMLNLPGAPPAAAAAAQPPRLMSGAATVGWDVDAARPAARNRNARIFLLLLGVVGIVCVVVTLAAVKKRTPPPVVATKPAVDPIAALAERAAELKQQPLEPKVEPPPEPVAQPAPLPTAKGAHKRGARSGRSVGPAPAPAPAPAPVAATDPNAARYRDTSRPNITVAAAAAANRPPPSQSDISRVINNNRAGIKNCYQRALLRDNSLTHGKITVKVTIGISGRVKYVGINGPQQFRTLEPCIRDVVSRWAFPQSSDEYGTEFAYVFQGNE